MGSEHKTMSGEPDSCHPILSIMANMVNYLNVSLYEGLFTYNDQQARARLNELYDSMSATPSDAPSIGHSVEFYKNVQYLRKVTDTDDPDYAIYMRIIYQYVRALEAKQNIQEHENKGKSVIYSQQELDDMKEESEAEKKQWQIERDRAAAAAAASEPGLYDDNDDIDWLQREREDWTNSIRSRNMYNR
jgi:hypothetical protein